MLKGLTPGAALVLLMAGPACNLASILVVRKVLGNRTLVVYLLSIVTGAILFGAGIDYLHFNDVVNFSGDIVMADACCHATDSLFSWLCTFSLLLLLLNALILRYFGKNETITVPAHQVYHIEGMACNHCRQAAENAILGVDGVVSASVDLQKKEAYVEGNASAEDIIKAVEAVGYECSEA